MLSPTSFVLPDLVKMCPWPWAVNPHCKTIGPASAEWIDSFCVFSDRKKEFFNTSNMGLLTGYCYPTITAEALQACSDWINLILVVDEYCDEQDGKRTREVADIFLDALNGKPRDDSAFSRIATDYRKRHILKMTEGVQRRLLDRFSSFIENVVREAGLRDNGKVLDYDTYMTVRRENGAVQTVFSLFEYVHGVEFPDEVHESPEYKRLYWLAVDLINVTNDVYSYSMEQARGIAGNNLITVLMETQGLSLQEASDRAGKLFQSMVQQFLADKKDLMARPFSTRGYSHSIDVGVTKCIEAMEMMITGYIGWSFDTPRYFGNDFQEVLKTRIVKLHEPMNLLLVAA